MKKIEIKVCFYYEIKEDAWIFKAIIPCDHISSDKYEKTINDAAQEFTNRIIDFKYDYKENK